MSDYGLKISKAGKDILTCAKKDQIFNSEATAFKVYNTFTGNISVAATDGGHLTQLTTVTVAHSLSYKPSYLFYWLDVTNDASTKLYYGNNGYIWVTVDATNFYINSESFTTFDSFGTPTFTPAQTKTYRIIAFIDEI